MRVREHPSIKGICDDYELTRAKSSRFCDFEVKDTLE
jgi:hypothetical protein